MVAHDANALVQIHRKDLSQLLLRPGGCVHGEIEAFPAWGLLGPGQWLAHQLEKLLQVPKAHQAEGLPHAARTQVECFRHCVGLLLQEECQERPRVPLHGGLEPRQPPPPGLELQPILVHRVVHHRPVRAQRLDFPLHVLGDVLGVVGVGQLASKVPVLANGKGLQPLVQVFWIVEVEPGDPERLLDRLGHPDVVQVVLVHPERIKGKDRVGPVLAKQVYDSLAQCHLGDVRQAVRLVAQFDDLGDAQNLGRPVQLGCVATLGLLQRQPYRILCVVRHPDQDHAPSLVGELGQRRPAERGCVVCVRADDHSCVHRCASCW